MVTAIDLLPKITFFPSPESIRSVTIETAHLLICSVSGKEQSDYESLFGNPKVMCTYASGVTKDAEYVQKRMKSWVDRWANGDPFSGFAVYEKWANGNTFIGHVVLGYGDIPGQSELAFLFLPQFWNQGYGKETVGAIIEHFAPTLLKLGYQVEGAPFHEIVATARSDNQASNRILNAFMECIGQKTQYGAERNVYSIKVEQLRVQNDDRLTRIELAANEARSKVA